MPDIFDQLQSAKGTGDIFDSLDIPEESYGKSALRTALQVPQGIAEGTKKFGIPTAFWHLLAQGELNDPEEIDRLKAISEREGVPFDEEAYEEAGRRALGTIPTVGNIASKIEEKTGVPLEPKTRIQKGLRFASTATKLAPKDYTVRGANTKLPKPALGAAAAATKETLQELGLPEPFAEVASFGIWKPTTAGSGKISYTKEKPSGMPERGFEKLKEPTEVPAKKMQQINDKLENDFKKVSENIIKDSPIGETAKNLAEDPAFKKDSKALLDQAQILANETPGTIPSIQYKKALAKQTQGQIKGFALNEYKKSYLKFIKEAVDNVIPKNVTYGELVEQYRENNRGLSEYFEPGASKALNRAKKDALLDQNRAIASVLEESNPELSKVFKEGNDRWTKIMDAEAVDNFVSDMFPEGKKVDFKHMKEVFDDPNYQRIFKRALGEKGLKDFELAVQDMLSAEKPYRMLRVAEKKGIAGDLAVTAKAYLIHPYAAAAKTAVDAARYAYRTLYNAILDKPQIALKFTKAVKELKSGNYKAAAKDFETVQAEIEPPPKHTNQRQTAKETKAPRNETVDVSVSKVNQPSQKAKTFKTEKGSVYEVNEDGTTTRNKAYRSEHGEIEQGIQKKSQKTWFISPENANKLGEFQAQGVGNKRIIELPDGRLGIMYETGKDAGKVEARTVITPEKGPAEGLIPVESWEGGKKVHFGNKIIEIETPQAKQIEHKPKIEENPSDFRDRFMAKKDLGATERLDSMGKKQTPKEKLIREMKKPSASTLAEEEIRTQKIKDELAKYPKEEIEWIYREAYPHLTEKALDLILARHGIAPKGKPKSKVKTKYPKTKEEVVAKKEKSELERVREKVEKQKSLYDEGVEKLRNGDLSKAKRKSLELETSNNHEGYVIEKRRLEKLENSERMRKVQEEVAAHLTKPAASLSETKINEIKRQDISKQGLKTQKEYILDHVEEALQKKLKGETVIFDVPGDGVFKIKNNESALKKFASLIEKKWPDKPLRKTFR